MKFYVALAVFGIGAFTVIVGCTPSQGDDEQQITCEQARAHLDQCIQEYCTTSEDAICSVLSNKTSGSLFDNDDNEGPSCDDMSQSDIDHLGAASCEEIIQDAKLLAGGKADFPCPTYFPWCNDVTSPSAFYHVNVLASDATGVTLEVLIGDVVTKTVMQDEEVFQELSLGGAGSLTKAGQPAVPTISFFVGIPSTTDEVAIDSINSDEVSEINNINVAPYVASSLEGDQRQPLVIDEDFYEQDIEVPGAEFYLGSLSTWRNYRVAHVTVYPFQYNPAQQRLSAARRVTLRLTFLDTEPGPEDTVEEGELDNEGAYSNSMVNYPEARLEEYGSGTPYEDPDRVRYLVIVDDPLIEAIQPLVDLKEQQGYVPMVVKLSEVGSEPQQIKDEIFEQYERSAIEYVLLVGDVDVLPFYTYELPWTSFYISDILGDYWYSLLVGDDMLPEVSVGRIAGKTPEEVSAHVAKTVAYETGDSMADWRKKILLLAHMQQYPYKYTACSEEVRTHEYRAGPIDFVKLYGGEDATNEEVVDEVNQGVGIIGYRGHGLADLWLGWNGNDFIASEQNFQNGDMTPVIFSIACLNLSMQEEQVTLGEQWVRHEGGGAVGFLGSTMKSWTSPNNLFMKQIFKGLLDDGITTVMPLINRARIEMIKQYKPDDSGPDNAMMYLWLGDPSLRVGRGFQVRAQAHVQWCNTQWPHELEATAGSPTEAIYGQVWSGGITEALGQGADIEGSVGFGPVGSDPSGDDWTWVPATYNMDKGNNDEYSASLTVPSEGVYSHAVRFKGEFDDDWTYCDTDGSQNGLSTDKLGTLTVQ